MLSNVLGKGSISKYGIVLLGNHIYLPLVSGQLFSTFRAKFPDVLNEP